METVGRSLERGELMGGKGSGRPPAPCGTTAAYKRHHKNGETPCQPCKDAHAADKRAKYKPRRPRKIYYVAGRATSLDRRKNEVRETIIAEKLRRGYCIDCNLTVTTENYFVFAFDHLDPALKKFQLSIAASTNKTVKAAQEEMAKCELVCHNCHMIRTWKERHYLARRNTFEQPRLFA